MTNISTSPRCRLCKEPINKEAIKCKHCGAFQNYLRYLSLFGQGQSFFALIFSFVSLFTSFYSLLNSIQIPKDHIIHVHFNSLGGGIKAQTTKTLSFYIWKKGKEPASIRKVWLVYQAKNNPEIKVNLYANEKSVLGFLEHDTKGEIFLKVVNPKKINFEKLKEIPAEQLSCKVQMTSFGLRQGIEKKIILKEEINNDDCYNFLISYEIDKS